MDINIDDARVRRLVRVEPGAVDRAEREVARHHPVPQQKPEQAPADRVDAGDGPRAWHLQAEQAFELLHAVAQSLQLIVTRHPRTAHHSNSNAAAAARATIALASRARPVTRPGGP